MSPMQCAHRRHEHAPAAAGRHIRLRRARCFDHLHGDCVSGSSQIACRANRNLPRAKIPPAGAFGQLLQLRARKRPRHGGPPICPRHAITKDKSGQQVNANARQKSAPEIGDEHVRAGQGPRLAQQSDCVFLAEVVQGERANHDVERLRGGERQHVVAKAGDLRVVRAQAAGSLDRGRLKIDRHNLHLCSDSARVVRDQTRNIRRAGGQIENAHAVAVLDPAAHEPRHDAMAAEVAIQPAQTAQGGLEFRGRRIRPIHQLRLVDLELPRAHAAGIICSKTSATTPAAEPSPHHSRCGLQTPAGTRCSCHKP